MRVVPLPLLPTLIATRKLISKAYQSVKIVSNADDVQFMNALHAISRIENFMVRHYSPMEGNGVTAMVGDIPAIRAENRLLVLRNSCQDGAMEPTQDVDPEGLLRATIRQGAHMYTEDNMVIFREWTQDAKGKL